MIPAIATGLTWLRAFKGPCLILAGVALVAGAASGGWLAHRLADGRVARAEAALERLRAEQTQAIADAAAKNVIVTQDVLEGLYAQRETIDRLAADVRRLRGAVSLCASVSTMPVPGPAADADRAPAGGQPRAAADVLQDLAAEFAERADRNAAQLNALIDWIERTR